MNVGDYLVRHYYRGKIVGSNYIYGAAGYKDAKQKYIEKTFTRFPKDHMEENTFKVTKVKRSNKV